MLSDERQQLFETTIDDVASVDCPRINGRSREDHRQAEMKDEAFFKKVVTFLRARLIIRMKNNKSARRTL